MVKSPCRLRQLNTRETSTVPDVSLRFHVKNFGYRRQAQLLRESITEKSTTARTNTATQTQFFRQEASEQQQSSAEKGNGDAR